MNSTESSPAKFNLWRDVLVALVVGSILLVGQWWVDDRRSDRETQTARVMADEADRRENLRFVRERSSEQSSDRPFANMDLVEQNLAQLNMANADFENARFMGAFMVGANLSDANLRTANLSNALLASATLMKADLHGADLRGARLNDAKLEGASIDTTCHDETTRWPVGFAPPASVKGVCVLHDEVERSAAHD